VTVNCDAGDPASVDRLLFGQPPPDAPTDLESVTADSRIAAACGGTLSLHNVTELRASAQAQLARIARDGEVRIDGAPVATALRFVASALPGIDADVHAHRFRGDLYRRLAVVRIDLPPLRERPDDVPALAMRLLADTCAGEGRPSRTFTQAALALFGALTWPGNLNELRTAVERVVADCGDDVIQIEHILPALQLHRAHAPVVPMGNLREARLRFERRR
jgi:DNA-binding NtrC family response regulator